MSEFYNAEYLTERLAAVCKERDELRREVVALRELCEKQGRLNLVNAKLAMDLEAVMAERDALLSEICGMCNLCKHYANGDGDDACPMCAWDSRFEWRGLDGKDG